MPKSNYSEGDKVEWNWGNGTAQGTVKSIFPEKTIRTINGEEVTRNGSKNDPAIYIEREKGNNVLKLSSEIRET